MANKAQKVIVRIGMSQEVPALAIGELGWDIDYHRLRAGDGSSTPTMIQTTKSIGPFEYNFIDYVQYPEIRMLPEGTVDGVDISDLNAANGFVVRRGNNLWAHRSLTNTDTYITIVNPAGTAGNPVINLSSEIVDRILDSLTEVAVDDITIHGNGRPEAPLYAHQASYADRGVVRLATGQEVIDGVSSSKAITPESLIARTATFTRTGLIRKATLEETEAGVNTDTAVVPAYLHNYVENYVENYFETNIVGYLQKSRIYTVRKVGSVFMDTSEQNLVLDKADITWPRMINLVARSSSNQDGYPWYLVWKYGSKIIAVSATPSELHKTSTARGVTVIDGKIYIIGIASNSYQGFESTDVEVATDGDYLEYIGDATSSTVTFKREAGGQALGGLVVPPKTYYFSVRDYLD